MKAKDKQLIEAALKAVKAQKVTFKSIKDKCIEEYDGVPLWMVTALGFCESAEVILQGLLSENLSTFYIIDDDGEEFYVDYALDYIYSFYDDEELPVNWLTV